MSIRVGDAGDRSIGAAIVGCGAIAPAHAAAFEASGAHLAGVFDEQDERAAELADRLHVRHYRALDELLADPNVEIVSVCTPSGTHADVAIPAARAGRHLLVEKPLDVSLERARGIVSACEEAGVRLAVVSQHRFDDSTIAVRAAIESGRLGRIVHASAQVLWYRTQSYYDSAAWRGTWKLDGGGALMNQSIHSIDLLRYLAGDVDRVAGRTALVAHTGIEVEDIGLATVRFRSGALGSIVGTTATFPGFGARIEVYGDRGAARIEDDELVLLSGGEDDDAGPAPAPTPVPAAGGGPSADPRALGAGSHARQVADLLAAIRDRRSPLVDGEEGLRTLEVVLAIYESARTGRDVELPIRGRGSRP